MMVLVPLILFISIGLIQASVDPCHLYFNRVAVVIGSNIGKHVENRLMAYLRSVDSVQVDTLTTNDIGEINIDVSENVQLLLLSFGNTTISQSVISEQFLQSLHPESFHLSFSSHNLTPNSYLFASNGLPLDPETHRNVSFNKDAVHYGAVVGAYAALEELGFAFMHPLQPTIPSQLHIRNAACYKYNTTDIEYNSESFIFNRTESPYWPERGFHIHTQHPLELTEVLQGHDIPQFGPHGPSCKQYTKQKPLDHVLNITVETSSRPEPSISTNTNTGTTPGTSSTTKQTEYCERWEDMVTDVDYLFEWAIANRLNKIEWLLLGNYKWGDEWGTRMNRLRILTTLGHQYSIMVGADVPLGNVQQHGWFIVNVRLPLSQQAEQIRQRVDLILSTGFDFLTTESGLSEFTHPECDHMLELINIFAEHVNVTWGREAAIKVHCSTGQSCEDLPDPRTGEPLNFNFLPTYAHPGMGVFPHTVQVYALDDPTAFAYGNENFSYVEDYMIYEAKLHNRSVSFYGETAYWVNVDIDVPLFLPLYGQRRQHDLRRLAVREQKESFRIDGQMNFDSGWEWGYWLSDVVTARASWDPKLGISGIVGMDVEERDKVCVSVGLDNECINSADYTAENHQNNLPYPSYEAKHDQWSAFASALLPYTTLYGPIYNTRLNNLLVKLTQIQAELLINGRINNTNSPDLRKLSGMAYLSGGDTWVDIPRLFGLAFTQPDKIHIRESHDPDWSYVLLLLQEMRIKFTDLSSEFDCLYEDILNYTTTTNSVGSSDSSNDATVVEQKFHINPAAVLLLSEITDSMKLLSLRAQQVHALYQSRDPEYIQDKKELQRQARGIVHEAEKVVVRREGQYRVPWQRVGEWRDNPTVYRFGYLWAVHTLYYWWRDQGLAEQGSFQSELSPCYLNRMDPIEVAVGWGKYTLEVLRAFINRYTPFSAGSPLEVVNCLSPPVKGYEFPRDLYHI